MEGKGKEENEQRLSTILAEAKSLPIFPLHTAQLSRAGENLHNLPVQSHYPKLVSVAQSCPTLFDPMDCSLPGSSVHGILQARILEWVAIPFFRGSY